MKKTLYIHIGTPKTATTYLQHFFNINADLLERDGLFFPNAPGKTYYPDQVYMHVPLVASTTGLKVNWLSPDYHFPNGEALEELLVDIQKNELDNVLLTSEVFYDAFTTAEEIERFALAFRPFNVKIIVYVRRQDEFLLSYFQEGCKGGNESELNVDNLMAKHEGNLRYYQRLLLWENAFGRENLIVRPFEKNQLINQDILSDFFALLNMTPPKDYRPVARLNESISFEKTLFLLKLNQFLVGSLDEADELTKVLHQDLRDRIINNQDILKEGKVHELLNYEDRKKIINHYAEENENLARRYLNRNDGKLFTPLEELQLDAMNSINRSLELSIEKEFNTVASLIKDWISEDQLKRT